MYMKKTFLFSIMIAFAAVMISCTKSGNVLSFMDENDQDSISCDTINTEMGSDSVYVYETVEEEK